MRTKQIPRTKNKLTSEHNKITKCYGTQLDKLTNEQNKNTEVNENDDKREKEQDVICNFSNLLESLEEEDHTIKTINIENDDVEMASQSTISFNNIVRFCTGSKFIMQSMVWKDAISFVYPDKQSQGRRVLARTCTLSRVFPVTQRYVDCIESFIENICNDIVSEPGFGMP